MIIDPYEILNLDQQLTSICTKSIQADQVMNSPNKYPSIII